MRCWVLEYGRSLTERLIRAKRPIGILLQRELPALWFKNCSQELVIKGGHTEKPATDINPLLNLKLLIVDENGLVGETGAGVHPLPCDGHLLHRLRGITDPLPLHLDALQQVAYR